MRNDFCDIVKELRMLGEISQVKLLYINTFDKQG